MNEDTFIFSEFTLLYMFITQVYFCLLSVFSEVNVCTVDAFAVFKTAKVFLLGSCFD